MHLILSPVGTSILTNSAGTHRSLIRDYANAKSEADIPEQHRLQLEEIRDAAIAKLSNADIATLRRQSAELNGIIGFYKGTLEPNSKDAHWLIATDTYLGKMAAEIVKTVLQTFFPYTQVKIPAGLSTNSKEDFLAGIRDLLKWCDETLKLSRHDYEVTFNLTGGFKSLQGYLNTIGMFYADKIVYIFEGSNELIVIPRLPAKLEVEIFDQFAAIFLLLNSEIEGLKKEEIRGIPDIMLEEYGSESFVLSGWGELSWNVAKESVLSKKLIELPGIKYLDSFKRDFQRIDRADEKVRLQEAVAKISFLLKIHHGDIARIKGGEGGGSLYSNYKGKHKDLGHFRVSNGLRVSCQYQDNILQLRHYGQHDEVNDNP